MIKHEEIRLIPLERYYDKGDFPRGYLKPIYKKQELQDLPDFVEDRLSISKKGVLRGLHGDNKTGKLFIPIQGVFQFFAINVLNPKDRLFYSLLGANMNTAIYVPPNYLNGHYCLTDDTIMLYKWTEPYDGPENQFTVDYKDPDLNISWDFKGESPIISERDRNGISFKELREQYENRIW